MKQKRNLAFTRWDLAICLAMIGMLVVWLPALYSPRTRGRGSCRINCVSNLKQIGLGFRMWSNDHEYQFPWQVPVAAGGTREFAQLPYAALHFLAASNELNSPKILTCSSDTNRIRTNVWSAPLHLSLSYLAVIDSTEFIPSALLAADRNISTNSAMVFGLVTVATPRDVLWTKDIHQHAGNIAFADGSVVQSTTSDLKKSVQRMLALSTNQMIRLAIP